MYIRSVLPATTTRLLRVDEVERMVGAGIIAEDEPLELLEGVLVVVNPQGPVHAGGIARIRAQLEALLPAAWIVREEKPLAVSDLSLPEPDLAVVPRRDDFYIHRHPESGEAALVIEVAKTSLDLDRGKAEIYARGGVPRYWIVDVEGERIECYSEPRAEGRYVTTRVLESGDDVETPWGPLAVDRLLPR